MEYIKVEYNQPPIDAPSTIIMEIDSNSRLELRKIEIFKNGKAIFADKFTFSDEIQLSWEPIPTFEEIALDEEFTPVKIEKYEFEEMWSRANDAKDNI
jgi:hypothetical protein